MSKKFEHLLSRISLAYKLRNKDLDCATFNVVLIDLGIKAAQWQGCRHRQIAEGALSECTSHTL